MSSKTKNNSRINYGVSRLARKILYSFFVNSFFVSGKLRARLYKLCGVNIKDPGSCFIGQGVMIDDMKPYSVTVGRNTVITSGVKILTHYLDLENVKSPHDTHKFIDGSVTIGENVFIGINVCIVNDVRIGDNVVIGANSVVTSDIPSDVVVGGVPAKIISYRQYTN